MCPPQELVRLIGLILYGDGTALRYAGRSAVTTSRVGSQGAPKSVPSEAEDSRVPRGSVIHLCMEDRSQHQEPTRHHPELPNVIATENRIAGTLIEHVDMTDGDGKTVRLTLADDGQMLEVAATYLGVGTRVLYQGDSIPDAVRTYNDLLRVVEDAEYHGDTTPLDEDSVAEAVVKARARA